MSEYNGEEKESAKEEATMRIEQPLLFCYFSFGFLLILFVVFCYISFGNLFLKFLSFLSMSNVFFILLNSVTI